MKKTIFNRRASALVLGLAIVAASGPARSADVIGEEPPVPVAVEEFVPVSNWSGGYAGVALGYAFSGQTDYTQPGPGNFDTEGFHGSGFAGYNFENGGLVYGLEGDAGYGNIDGTDGITSVESGFDASLRARLGFAATDRILIYGTGGGAVARLEAVEGGVSDDQTAFGWTAGGGIDAKITDTVFGRAEYRYTDYGSKDFATGSGTNAIDAQQNSVRLGLGVKF